MGVPKFRRGLTVHQRDQIRADIWAREAERARRRTELAHVSPECRNAMSLTGAEPGPYVATLHVQCKGELPGSYGCLCRCHDDVGEGVVTGFVA